MHLSLAGAAISERVTVAPFLARDFEHDAAFQPRAVPQRTVALIRTWGESLMYFAGRCGRHFWPSVQWAIEVAMVAPIDLWLREAQGPPREKLRRATTLFIGGFMKLLRTTALTAALMTAAVPSLTTPANAWGWRGGWGWGGVGLGLAAGALIGGAIAASSYGYGYPYSGYGYGYPAYGYGYGYAPSYGYAGYGYGYPAYSYGYGTGYYGGYGYAYRPVARHIYATTVGVRRHWR